MFILQANGGNVCRQTGPGTATLTSRRSASVSAGTLIFETELTSDGNVGQADLNAVGLVAGTDRNNAIEFLTAGTGLSQTQMACRTVSGGVTTQTVVEVTPGLDHNYRIFASSNSVNFYVDGVLVANHTTNIPTSALNVFIGIGATGTSYAAFIPSYVSFEFVPSSP